jgi:hypothetical protein
MNASESEAATLEKQGWQVSTHAEWMRMNGKGEPLHAEPDQPEPAKRRGRPPKAK